MSANIAFSAPGFSAVGTDTRITKTVYGQTYTVDTASDAFKLPVYEPFPEPYVKLRPAGNGWVTGLGELASAEFILDALNAASADTYEKALLALSNQKGWQAEVMKAHKRTIEQLETTEIFGAPFSISELGNWRLGLQHNDPRTRDRLLTIVNWGGQTTPAGGDELRAEIDALRGYAQPHSVASAMARIILLAAAADASVGPNMQFGFTASITGGRLQRGFYNGPAKDVLKMNGDDFAKALVQPH
ncbi:hypothetical protein [Comamonas sp. lk]|uniref:hypothetical protein n=1 Tax=Comamonas sp. lk TaxID=2201272 RepID=UPI0013CECED0|nr:hypothetical protein [Comamonas sp. lk]